MNRHTYSKVPILFFAIGLFLLSCKSSDSIPLGDGLLSYYPFNNNTDDAMGNYDATGYGETYAKDPPVNPGPYLELNGNNSYVDLDSPFDLVRRSVSLWFKVKDAGNDFAIIYCSDHLLLNFGMTVLAVKKADSGYKLYYNFSSQLDSVKITANTWYHATITTDHTAYAYYLDGELVKSGDGGYYNRSYEGVATTVIGVDRLLSSRFFNGCVDNVRIYSRSLSAKEVKDLYLLRFN